MPHRSEAVSLARRRNLSPITQARERGRVRLSLQPCAPPRGRIGPKSNRPRSHRQSPRPLRKLVFPREKQKEPPYDKINPDPYAHAKRTARRLAATPAPQSDRVGPASHTPRAGACRLLELLARAPRRHRWSTIPARFWRNRSTAHLNLSPRQWRWLTKSTPTPSFGNRFTTTCGSSIPNGSN